MIVTVKYFYGEMEECDRLFAENARRIVDLHSTFPVQLQMSSMERNIMDETDILVIRSPTDFYIKRNPIVCNILQGKGFVCNNGKTWYPKEVWICEQIEITSIYL
jgi:hypothetical protein